MENFAVHNSAAHKIGAEHVKQHLQQNRNLSLSNEEALEIVAIALGGTRPVAPSSSSGQVSKIEPERYAKDRLLALALRLNFFYGLPNGGANAHPVFPVQDWARDRSSGETSLEYWEWAAEKTENSKGMWPWERETERNVLIARAALLYVSFDNGRGWLILGENAPNLPPSSSEREAWDAAADDVVKRLELWGALSNEELASMPTYSLVSYVTGAQSSAANEPVMRVSSGIHLHVYEPEAQVERLTEDASATLCIALGRIIINREKNQPTPWTTDDLVFYATEAEAWQAGADKVRREVMRKAGLSFWEWAGASVEEQIAFGKKYLG